MEKKFVEREKLSKKARKALDNRNRVTWGSMDPRAKKVESKKVYNRKRFYNFLSVYHFTVSLF